MATAEVGFVRNKNGEERCGNCLFLDTNGVSCLNWQVDADPELSAEPRASDGTLIVGDGDYCNEWQPVKQEEDKAMRDKKFEKFIPFAKVDEARREVWGIVTAEVPDKDDEVCDYDGSKPFYQAVIDEMSKATGGENFFPLRYMHQLDAVGKCIGFDFRDADKEIFMGFKVVDDEAWNKVLEKVLTGFSQGGSIVGPMKPDPKFDGCQRYVANPSEVSLVDNPCLASAHYTLVRADGAIELCKFAKTVAAEPTQARFKALETELTLLKSQILKKDAKTKRVDGEDLPAPAFLIVGDKDDTSTWKLPVKFSTDEKTKAHLRNALSRFNQLKDVSQADKDKAWKKLVALCEKHGIDVEAEKAKFAAIFDYLRKRARIAVNRLSRKVRGGNVGFLLGTLDSDLGRMRKGMYEVSALAQIIQELVYLIYNVVQEQQWEEDSDSPLPGMFAESLEPILSTLLAMVEEESEEIRQDVRIRTAATT